MHTNTPQEHHDEARPLTPEERQKLLHNLHTLLPPSMSGRDMTMVVCAVIDTYSLSDDEVDVLFDAITEFRKFREDARAAAAAAAAAVAAGETDDGAQWGMDTPVRGSKEGLH